MEWYKCGGKDQGAWWGEGKDGQESTEEEVQTTKQSGKEGKKKQEMCYFQWPDPPEGLMVCSSDHTCRLWSCDGQAVIGITHKKVKNVFLAKA